MRKNPQKDEAANANTTKDDVARLIRSYNAVIKQKGTRCT